MSAIGYRGTAVPKYRSTEAVELRAALSVATLTFVIEDLPRLNIGTWPTPVRRMELVSERVGCDVWGKLEEDCGAWGGNKVRKLEFILAAAQRDGVRTLVSYGAGTSNWTTALAHHASRIGLRTVAGLTGPVPADHARLYERTGTKLVTAPWAALAGPVAVAARLVAGIRARPIPPGGSGNGDVGSLHAGYELADAITASEIPRPAAIFVAAGTCGTIAGMAAGLMERGFDIPIVAARVTPLPLGTPRLIHRRIASLRKVLAAHGIAMRTDARIIGDDRFFKPGYAKTNPASREAAEIAALDRISLDPTYASKAFASLLDAARSGAEGPLLFIHTSPGPPPD